MSALLKNLPDRPAASVLICSSAVHVDAARTQLAAKNSKNIVAHLSDDLSVVAGCRVVLLLKVKAKPGDVFVKLLIDKGATSIKAACIPEVTPEDFDPIRHVNENSDAIWSRPEVAAAAPVQVTGLVDADPVPAEVPAAPVAEVDADAELEAANEAAWRAVQEDGNGAGWVPPAAASVSVPAPHRADIDFKGLMEPVARCLLKGLNEQMSTATNLRYGTNGSLSVNLEDGTWYDHEHLVGGGVLDLIMRVLGMTEEADAAAWLRQRGLTATPAQAPAPKAKPRGSFNVVATYPYVDAKGELLFEVCRMDPKDFRQRRPDPSAPTGWTWSVKGVTQVPYRLPQMLATPDAMVFLPEGEKDVDNLFDVGLIASCNAGGAGKWRDELTPHFAGRHVVLLQDNDEAGRDHARKVASKLLGIAASVRILELPGLPPKGDVSDWLLAAGGTRDQLLQLASEAPLVHAAEPSAAPESFDALPPFDMDDWLHGAPKAAKPTLPPYAFIRVGDMSLKAIDWLIKSYLEGDSLALLFSDPGVGKSFMAIDMACCVATGRPWHDNATTKGAVFYIAGEGHNGLKRRFTAWQIDNGVDLNDAPLYVSKEPAKLSVEDSAQAVIDAVRALASQTGVQPRLIVVDTVARNFGPGDENSTQEMGEFIANLDRLKNEFKATVLLVHHSGHGDKSRARGSMALKGALDAEYRLERGDDEAGVIRFETTKMKEAEFPEPLSFRLESVKLPLIDDEGNEMTSAVMRATMHVPKAKPGKVASGRNQLKALQILRQLEGEHRAHVEGSGRGPEEARVKEESWRTQLADAGLGRGAFRDLKKSLLAAALIEVDSGGYVREA